MSTSSTSSGSSAAQIELPAIVQMAHDRPWTLSGEGVFSWTVFRFYRARLFVSGDRYEAAAPHILDLEYLRSLLASQIVSVAMDEIRRLRACDEKSLAQWSECLLAFLPDVSLGDRLVGVFSPGEGVMFYSGHGFLGQISDPVFAEAFAAIWLDPQSKADQLRLALLGLSAQVARAQS